MPAVMIQGTGSNVGKSLLVAGLCRAARKRGINVAPFKPQNMSNNAAVCPEGGEIGRAQAVQAEAAGLAPHVDMNPVLIKPESSTGAQIVVQGARLTRAEAQDYQGLKPRLLAAVRDSFARLSAQHDLVIVEGAGSAAEVNLRKGDIANMGFACAENIPVILAGDIDRGGVIAQIVGTKAVLDDQDRAQIAGFLINRFRGDPRLFDEGYRYIAEQTGWPGFGVVPWFGDAWKLPAEDGVDLGKTPTHDGAFHVAALAFPRISNFDDLDPIAQDPKLRLTWVEAGRVIPADADLVILPGSKSTRADLEFLRAQGWDVDLAAHRRRGGAILGLCGGYQMLGRRISDPEGLDGAVGVTDGLGLLEIETLMRPQKRLALSAAHHVPTGAAVSGYEIHMGETSGPDCTRPFAALTGHKDGAISADGRVMGSYLHGLFQEDGFRTAFFAGLGAEISAVGYRAQIGAVLDDLAQHLETHLDVDAIFDLAR